MATGLNIVKYMT